ncbi:MAG: glycosyltransferase, partial [Microbacterium sp.]
ATTWPVGSFRAASVDDAADRLVAVLREEDADLLVANSLKAAVLLGLVSGRRPWVWHLHDRLATDYLATPVVLALRVLARFGPRRIVANSLATASTAGRLPSGRVAVAYPGIESSAFARPKRSPGRGPIGIVGRIAPTKGQREFVEAAALVAESHPRSRFRIVGAALFDDAGYARTLDERIAASGLGDRLEQTGWSDSPAAEFRRLRMLVHASPVPEPFGQVIVEAIAVGTPVVATDAGGVGEILDPRGRAVEIADGVRRAPNGLLVRPGDAGALAAAIAWTLDHRPEAADSARAAHDDARARFTIERTWAVVSTVWWSAARR